MCARGPVWDRPLRKGRQVSGTPWGGCPHPPAPENFSFSVGAAFGRPLFEGRFSVWRGLAPAAPEASISVVGRGLPDAPPRNSGRRRGGDTRSRPALRLKIEYGFFGSTKSGRHAPSAGANRHIVLAARGTMRWVRLPSYVYVRYRYMGTVTYDVYHRTPVLCGWVWG